MIEYYPIKIKLNNSFYYLIWYTEEKDGFITEDSKIIYFVDKVELEHYINKKKINMEMDYTKYDFDKIKGIIKDIDLKFDCKTMLDAWNFFSDLAKSIDCNFKGNFDIENTITVYSKLVYGSNMAALNNSQREYKPDWDEKELARLSNILTNGLTILENCIDI